MRPWPAAVWAISYWRSCRNLAESSSAPGVEIKNATRAPPVPASAGFNHPLRSCRTSATYSVNNARMPVYLVPALRPAKMPDQMAKRRVDAPSTDDCPLSSDEVDGGVDRTGLTSLRA